MSSISAANSRRVGSSRAISGQPADSLRLDRWIVFVCCIMVFGLFIDGWAHNHDKVDDTFFTPWHATLYGAYAVAALSLIVVHFLNVNKGFHWRRALPAGYMPALAGALLFALGGLLDMLWHESFGIEVGIDALLSPTHLLLAFSGLLIITGPIRAFWQRQTDHDWSSLLPPIISFATVAAVLTFFTGFAAVTGKTIELVGARPPEPMVDLYDQYGIQALATQSNILLGIILIMTRRWRLPFGAITLIFVINAMGMTWIHVKNDAEFLLVANAAVAGLVGDFLLHRTVYASKNGLRFFCFALPLVFSLGALLCLNVLGNGPWGTGGLWWEVHLQLGAPVIAGTFGYGLSLLLYPPSAPGKTA